MQKSPRFSLVDSAADSDFCYYYTILLVRRFQKNSKKKPGDFFVGHFSWNSSILQCRRLVDLESFY